jgi:hypothetical protein
MKQNGAAERRNQIADISYAPALLAGGLMLLVWGVIGHWPAALGGIALSGGAVYRWISELKTGKAIK